MIFKVSIKLALMQLKVSTSKNTKLAFLWLEKVLPPIDQLVGLHADLFLVKPMIEKVTFISPNWMRDLLVSSWTY